MMNKYSIETNSNNFKDISNELDSLFAFENLESEQLIEFRESIEHKINQNKKQYKKELNEFIKCCLISLIPFISIVLLICFKIISLWFVLLLFLIIFFIYSFKSPNSSLKENAAKLSEFLKDEFEIAECYYVKVVGNIAESILFGSYCDVQIETKNKEYIESTISFSLLDVLSDEGFENLFNFESIDYNLNDENIKSDIEEKHISTMVDKSPIYFLKLKAKDECIVIISN